MVDATKLPERLSYPVTAATFHQQYHACQTGLHVVGFRDDLPHGPHFTICNVLMSESAARSAFMTVRSAFEVTEPEGDLIVDLMVDGSCEDNFFMRRQMVEPMQRSLTDVPE